MRLRKKTIIALFNETQSLFTIQKFKAKKRKKLTERRRRKKTKKQPKFQPDLFIPQKSNKAMYSAHWIYNWENEQKRKEIRFESYMESIEKVAKNIARKYGLDWEDLAFGEGFFIFEKLKTVWNPAICNFDAYFYGMLKNRMLDRLQKKDTRQPGVRCGNGKYFQAPIYAGVGAELEKIYYSKPDFN